MLDMVVVGTAPEGYSGLSCPECAYAYTHDQTSGLDTSLRYCPGCGVLILVPDLHLRGQVGALSYVDDDFTRGSRWFHATQRRGWLDAVQSSEVPVHIGTELAAITRSLGLDRVGDARANSPWWVYELEIARNTHILPGVHGDLTYTWPDSMAEFEEEMGETADAVRYLNRYEDPGSISLLVDPYFIRAANVRVYDIAAMEKRVREIIAARG